MIRRTPETRNWGIAIQQISASALARIVSHQPIEAEARHDPSADQHDESNECGNADTDAVVRAAAVNDLRVKNDIADDQHAEHGSANCGRR